MMAGSFKVLFRKKKKKKNISQRLKCKYVYMEKAHYIYWLLTFLFSWLKYHHYAVIFFS